MQLVGVNGSTCMLAQMVTSFTAKFLLVLLRCKKILNCLNNNLYLMLISII